MSYDLYFKSRDLPLTVDQFSAYFSARDCYKVEGGQVTYQNEDTGVYFHFELCDPSEIEPDGPPPLAFNMNYFRPHYFGLEAAPEVEAFIKAFDLDIEDPQVDGMGMGPFTTAGFLKSWNAGNRVAYRAILRSEHCPEVLVYPSEALDRIWRWNFGRRQLQHEAGDSLFVPKFMFMKQGTRVCTAVVWPDACPIYMPRADLVFLFRQELCQNTGDESQDYAIIEWESIVPLVTEFPTSSDGLPYYKVAYDTPPNEVVEFVRSQPASQPDARMGIANDSVLNTELVAEVLQGVD